MLYLNEKFIQLPSKGHLLVVTDLHGNLDDYKKYIQLWECDNPDSHIVFVGDFIHSTDDDDGSIEIIEDVMDKYKKYPNFHPLLGNHEWSHIVNTPVFKGYSNQSINFENLIFEKKGSVEPYLSKYVDFFRMMPYFLRTENGLFISHTGPSKLINTMDDFKKIFSDDFHNPALRDFLWNRYDEDYSEEDVDNFLEVIDSKFMVVGHTVVFGYLTHGNQIILSSSFASVKKAYLDIDLSIPINNMDELKKNIKYLD